MNEMREKNVNLDASPSHTSQPAGGLASSEMHLEDDESSLVNDLSVDEIHVGSMSTQPTVEFNPSQPNHARTLETISDTAYQLLSVEQVQKALNRSRASIYRYANTESGELNPPIDPNRLNPEPRRHKDEPLKFALSEVERFATHVLGIRGITIEVQESPDYVNQELMKAILDELKAIRALLESKHI